jgi:anaerobic selenocysteine-containing dehydrogenase
MCRAIEEMMKEVVREKSIQIAANIIELDKYPLEEIAKCCGLTLEEVQELAAEINAPA